jgi:hypothetical protein
MMSINRFKRNCVAAVWMILTLGYLFSGTGRSPIRERVSSDGNYYYHYLVSLMEDGDLDFSNNYVAANDQYQFRNIQVPATGKMPNTFYIGPTIVWVVPYLTVRSFLQLAGDWDSESSPWSAGVQTIVMYSAVVVAVWIFFMLMQLCGLWFDDRVSACAAALTIFATNVLWYVLREPSMSHVYDLAALLTGVYFFQMYIERLRTIDLLASGAAFGFGVCVRVQNLVTVAIVSAFLLVWWLRCGRFQLKFAKTWLLWFLAVSLFAMPHFVAFAYLYGDAFAQAYRYVDPNPDVFFVLTRPMMMDVLFSWRNGFFSFHPIWLAGALGAVMLLRKRQYTSLVLMLGVLFFAQLYLNSCVIDWWAGHSFGQRRLIGVIPVFSVGLAMIIERMCVNRHRKFSLAVLVALTVSWNIWLANGYENHWNKNDPQNLFQNLMNIF